VKFRLLEEKELKELEKEFIDYLVLNGITADDWIQIKENEPKRASQITDYFSDVVFESIFRKAQYLQYTSKIELKAFQCLEDKMVLVGLKTSTNSGVDFNDLETLKKNIGKVDVYTTEKKYDKQREIELFEMTEKGCVISDGDLFKRVALFL